MGSGPLPLNNHKTKGFLSNITSVDFLKTHTSTKPAFNVELSSVRQRNGVSVPFKWRFVGGQMITRF